MTEQEWLDIFGENLLDLMREKGYSQKDLACDTELAESTISSYVNKRKMPSVRALIAISYVLDISLDELMDFGERVY